MPPDLGGARRFLRTLLESVVLALMSLLALIVVAAIVFRKAGASLVWYDEVASIVLVWLTYYGSCLAALDRAHIGFPRIVDSLGGWPRRMLVAFREIVVVGFFVLVAWAGWRVLTVLEGTYLVSLPWVSTEVTQSVIPIGAVLFIVAELLALAAGADQGGRGNAEADSP